MSPKYSCYRFRHSFDQMFVRKGEASGDTANQNHQNYVLQGS